MGMGTTCGICIAVRVHGHNPWYHNSRMGMGISCNMFGAVCIGMAKGRGMCIAVCAVSLVMCITGIVRW